MKSVVTKVNFKENALKVSCTMDESFNKLGNWERQGFNRLHIREV